MVHSEENIENFFKTFGKPHEDGDSVYGKFRMGRGIMAFTKKDSFVEHDDELIEDYIPDEVDTELLN